MTTNRQALQQMTNEDIAEVFVSLIQCLGDKHCPIPCPLGKNCMFSVDKYGCDPWASSKLPCCETFELWLNAEDNTKMLLNDDNYKEQFHAWLKKLKKRQISD